jgi:hypothetical protein
VPRRPPDPIPEVPPDQRPEGEGVTWVPGYWAWDAERNDFLWVSGVWRVPPPGRKWVPGSWVAADGGYRWVPGIWAPDGQEGMQYLPPPPASLDTGPNGPPPDDNSLWAPGCWVYRMQRYVWQPGYWMAGRPNLLWTPPCYTWTPSGYVFVDGYWDAPLANRGLLFAPVSFNQPLWQTPGWTFRPSSFIDPGALLSSLFLGPSYGSYYFGDYYGPSYRQQGFLPWFSSGRNYYNPLLSYYAWRNRGNPGWYRGLSNTFQGRYAGSLARPRTFAAPNRPGPSGGLAVNTLQVVRPLAQVRNSGVRPGTSQVIRQRNMVRQVWSAPPSPRPQGAVSHVLSHGPFPAGPGLHRQPVPAAPHVSPHSAPRPPQPAYRPAPAAVHVAPRPQHSPPAPAFHAASRPAPAPHAAHKPAPPPPGSHGGGHAHAPSAHHH